MKQQKKKIVVLFVSSGNKLLIVEVKRTVHNSIRILHVRKTIIARYLSPIEGEIFYYKLLCGTKVDSDDALTLAKHRAAIKTKTK